MNQADFYNLYESQGLSPQTIKTFQEIIYDYFSSNERSFSWRTDITPYRVVISEIMLQQTQTGRVAEKFDDFVTLFPDFQTLAKAPFEEVLRSWKGLGYNRRAINLQKIAVTVTEQFKGDLPQSPEKLASLPGIGQATASSICAFAFNAPTIFIETNIRTVFIYFFYQGVIKEPINDRDLITLVRATIDHQNPRSWYYALMDYGVMLKKTVGNLSRLSKHYTKQSTFNGSDRQLRGKILQLLLDRKEIDSDHLPNLLNQEKIRISTILTQLVNEGFIKKSGNKIIIH